MEESSVLYINGISFCFVFFLAHQLTLSSALVWKGNISVRSESKGQIQLWHPKQAGGFRLGCVVKSEGRGPNLK